ncbi:hypothetical protein BDV40DRAFT_299595 [Aspergillus tamarii]|uniref:Uncharacterized protein n=1 Tax=Aspergillus tamarii TaxID=41984 RepID=A0A5N6UZP1_ASPTM|nr:hypothetical protein BDV40DRAFT_299595 [Aspergillus tamarii]
MGWFGDDSDEAQAWNEVINAPHKAELPHELIGTAAAYEAGKAYEKHVATNGLPPNHARAKEIVAGFAGAYIERIIETKGLDYIDKQEAIEQAVEITAYFVAKDY